MSGRRSESFSLADHEVEYFTSSLDGKTVALTTKFAAQVDEVKKILTNEGSLNAVKLEQEVNWFYDHLGLHEFYFQTTTPDVIAKHILSIEAAKILAESSGNEFEMNLAQETEKDALFVARSSPGNSKSVCVDIERKIEGKYLCEGYHNSATHTASMAAASASLDAPNSSSCSNCPSATSIHPWRLQCYRSNGYVSTKVKQHVRLYFLQAPVFSQHCQNKDCTDMEQIASSQFLSTASQNTRDLYASVIKEVVARPGGLGVRMELKTSPSGSSHRLVVAYRTGTTHSFLSSVMDVYHYYKLFSPRKFVEPFSNGVIVYTFYLKSVDGNDELTESRVLSVMNDLSLKYALPRTSLTDLLQDGKLSNQEVSYAYACWKFSFHFLNRTGDEYGSLVRALANDPVNLANLQKLKSRLKKNTFTEDIILKAIYDFPLVVKRLFAEFDQLHNPLVQRKKSADGAASDADAAAAELETIISRNIDDVTAQEIFRAFKTFNHHVLKTNFYKHDKSAISFRLNPAFLPRNDFPEVPFGMFFVVGSEFRGFHVRFADVARGGIRVVRSASNAAFLHNVNTIFDENYGLALTQQRKNKDIPEGGAKGTILLSLNAQDKAEVAFKKYIDSLLDLLLVPHGEVIDKYGKEEILFLGPDEGTADVMDWAAHHARARGAGFWKAFTTGKSQSLGGIPHDLYGMTTCGVQRFVNGIYRKLGLDEHQIRKFQTGGPDGDLGSNSIKMSNDKTIGIVDGSGVLYDPLGLDRPELARLADLRKPVSFFDASKLSPQGFLVKVEDRDVTLPDGTKVLNGVTFRNDFHLNPLSSADCFVPCGGRPEAVNLTNVDRMFDAQGKPRFRYIVEGANIFFTQEARLALEKAGVIIFKDASANKGGVTSSSMEVLAALALTDAEYEQDMMKKGSAVPAFYETYVTEVQSRIANNADLEFECIWKEKQHCNTPNAVLTDSLSVKIVKLQADIERSSLWDDENLRRKVLSEAMPKMLLDKLGLNTIIERLPSAYSKAIFGSWLASRFVYEFGLSAGDLAFYQFLRQYMSN
eukprot:GILI01000975.1.p1 GENE.GILI01000975.1~~GILI01000975.1.p1  ORF type:complete len:1068 (-),score=387.39 GILI01000975.1:8-3133(-)